MLEWNSTISECAPNIVSGTSGIDQEYFLYESNFSDVVDAPSCRLYLLGILL